MVSCACTTVSLLPCLSITPCLAVFVLSISCILEFVWCSLVTAMRRLTYHVVCVCDTSNHVRKPAHRRHGV